MTEYDIKLLKLLDSQVQSCKLCQLYNNGRAKPFWTNTSYCVMLLEAPGKDEVIQNTPVVGTAGNKLWALANEVGLQREDFLIVNSVNCRPVNGNKNGKPTTEEMTSCAPWIRKYIKIIKPEKLLVMGRYAIESFNRIVGSNILPVDSIVDNNGSVIPVDFFGISLSVVVSVHPAWAMIYNPTVGIEKLKDSLSIFKKL